MKANKKIKHPLKKYYAQFAFNKQPIIFRENVGIFFVIYAFKLIF
jgi:hypothetical protein